MVQLTKSLADDARVRSEVGLGLKVNYSSFSQETSGDLYLHGYTDETPSDTDGYVMWNGIQRTVPRRLINPGSVCPYYQTIHIVLRLTSQTSTNGTLYMVWYDNKWVYAVTPSPASVSGDWTWNEAIDIVLGQFVEPSLNGQLIDAYLYDPPRTASQVKTTGNNAFKYSQSAVNWVTNNGTTMLTAAEIIDNWATDATDATTTIKGGLIQTHTITSQQLATDAIISNNYQASIDTTSPFSAAGSFLDLANGNFQTRDFAIINERPSGTSLPVGAFFNGTVYASQGHFGNSNQYWNIETVYDYLMQPHAALVGTGSPYLQTLNW